MSYSSADPIWWLGECLMQGMSEDDGLQDLGLDPLRREVKVAHFLGERALFNLVYHKLGQHYSKL